MEQTDGRFARRGPLLQLDAGGPWVDVRAVTRVDEYEAPDGERRVALGGRGIGLGHEGRDVEVDTDPRCPACGKRLGEYFGLPRSVRCRNCGHQARRD